MGFWDKVQEHYGSWSSILLILFMAWFGLYTVDFENNLHYENFTTQENKTIQKEVLFYGSQDEVPVKNVGENDTKQYTALVWLAQIAGVLIYIFIQKKDYEGHIYDLEDAQNKLEEYLSQRKDIDNFFVWEQGYEQWKSRDNNDPYKMSIWVFATVTFNELAPEMIRGTTWYGYKYDPKTLKFKGKAERPQLNGIQPICPKCGEFPDEKDLSKEYFQKERDFYKK